MTWWEIATIACMENFMMGKFTGLEAVIIYLETVLVHKSDPQCFVGRSHDLTMPPPIPNMGKALQQLKSQNSQVKISFEIIWVVRGIYGSHDLLTPLFFFLIWK